MDTAYIEKRIKFAEYDIELALGDLEMDPDNFCVRLESAINELTDAREYMITALEELKYEESLDEGKKRRKQPELPMGGLHPLEDAAAGIDNFNASFGGECTDGGCGAIGEAIKMSKLIREEFYTPQDIDELKNAVIDLCNDYGFELDYKNLAQPVGRTMMGNLHFQIIGTEPNQQRPIAELENAPEDEVMNFLKGGFEEFADALEEYCEEHLGVRCTYSAGIDQDGCITCGFDIYDIKDIFPEER